MSRISDRLAYFAKIKQRSEDLKTFVAKASGKPVTGGIPASDTDRQDYPTPPTPYVTERNEKEIRCSVDYVTPANQGIVVNQDLKARAQKVAKGHLRGASNYLVREIIVEDHDVRGYTIMTGYDPTMGSIARSAEGPYGPGAEVVLTVTPKSGYQFAGWSDGISTNPRTFTIDHSDIIINANFEEVVVAGPLTFTSSGTSTVYLDNSGNTPDCEYSVDGGESWSAMSTDEEHPLSFTGSMLIRGLNAEGFCKDSEHVSVFTFEGDDVTISGNIMSLIDRTGETTTIPNAYCFAFLFNYNDVLVSAEDLVLPPHTTENCYCSMFDSCTSLTTAPTLPATILANDCYAYMFYGCSSLNEIHCNATTMGTNSTLEWVGGVDGQGVAAFGTFYRDANTTWSVGVSGAPYGWKVVPFTYTYVKEDLIFEGDPGDWPVAVVDDASQYFEGASVGDTLTVHFQGVDSLGAEHEFAGTLVFNVEGRYDPDPETMPRGTRAWSLIHNTEAEVPYYGITFG